MSSKISYSHFEKDFLVDLICSNYDIFTPDTIDLKLFNNGFNVIYHLTTEHGGSWMFRVRPSYDYYDITPENVAFVLNFQSYLNDQGFPVPAILSRSDGSLYGCIIAPEGCRYYSVHEVVPGQSPFPISGQQARMIGEQLATMHLLSRNYHPDKVRLYFTHEQMLERPMELFREHPNLLGQYQDWFESQIDEISGVVSQMNFNNKDFVIIHGDFWFGNVLLEDHKAQFIDFDFACYAPRELDLASFLILGYQRVIGAGQALSQIDELYGDLIHGYHSAWEDAIDKQLLISLARARVIWTIGGYLAVIGIQSYSGIKKRVNTLLQILNYLDSADFLFD